METVRLTPRSRLRRLVKTNRLRLTGSAFQSLAPSHLRENAASECRDRACTGMTERKAFLQLVEREHGFLGAMVVELLVLELQVFELFAEHQARSEAGAYRPFRLRSTLAFDDSLRRVAYGSQACYKPWRPEAWCGMHAGWLRGRTPCRLR